MTCYCALNLFSLTDASPDDTRNNPTIVAGFALLTAERTAIAWKFDIVSDVVLCPTDEPRLLERLADCLPLADHLIGWQIERDVTSPLLIAAERVPPVLRHFLLCRLARAAAGNAIDRAIGYGGLRAPPFATVALMRPVVEHVAPRAAIEAHWHAGNARAVDAALRVEALALWRSFVTSAPRAVNDDVVACTDSWAAGWRR